MVIFRTCTGFFGLSSLSVGTLLMAIKMSMPEHTCCRGSAVQCRVVKYSTEPGYSNWGRGRVRKVWGEE